MIAIMQPYIFPKLSYWKLINCVDAFVIHDDVQYIKGGWINKNRILVNNKIKNFSIPIKQDNHNKMINERFLAENWKKKKKKLLLIIKEGYRKSCNFKKIYPLIEKILNFDSNNLSKFLTNSIIETNKYLNINTKIIYSSSLNINKKFKKEKKIIEICRILSANKYINSIGGQKIYEKNEFKKSNIDLFFLNPIEESGKKNLNTTHVDLSILDIIMNIDKEKIQKELNQYKLI